MKHTWVFLLLPLVSACATPPFGRITDGDTGLPIEGAHVSISQRISIPQPAHGGSATLFISAVTTNANGEYPMPWFVGPLIPYGPSNTDLRAPMDIDIQVTKQGYGYGPDNPYKSINIKLLKSTVSK